jgi:hypothetical protein
MCLSTLSCGHMASSSPIKSPLWVFVRIPALGTEPTMANRGDLISRFLTLERPFLQIRSHLFFQEFGYGHFLEGHRSTMTQLNNCVLVYLQTRHQTSGHLDFLLGFPQKVL